MQPIRRGGVVVSADIYRPPSWLILVVIDPKEKTEYVLCHCHENNLRTLTANAKAIAALPDLMDALHDCSMAMEGLLAALKIPQKENETLLQAARSALLAAGYTE